MKAPNRNKYRNYKLENGYGSFDSKKEFRIYLLLLDKCKHGKLTNLKRQVRFELIPAQHIKEQIKLKTKTKEVKKLLFRSCCYIADFTYIDEHGNLVVVDVKSTITAKDKVYLLKKKMMYWKYGIMITEI